MIARRTWHAIISVVCAFIVIYFLYHTIQGDRGWLSMLRLQNEVTAARGNLDQLQKEREELAHRVQLMRPGSLDPDLLDEKSREMLDYSKPNEIIILTPQDKKPGVVQRNN
ncbi:MAG: septum formation initiator family protein [Alphaproteobacteria bacterium]